MAAVVVLWTSVCAGMLATGLGLFDEEPISYLATDPQGAALFRGGLLVASVLLVAFAGFVWRAWSPARGFLAAFLTGQVCQVIVAVVPIDGPGADHAVHTTAGIVLGLSLPVLIWRFAAGLPPGPRRSGAYRLLWLEVAACVVGVALSRAMLAPLAEALPATGFHLWILVVTAWRPSAAPAPSHASAP